MNKYLEINRIYCMDCFKFLKKVHPGTVDLAIIDPPYNMSKATWDKFDSHEKFMKFTYLWIDALIPLLKANGSIYIFNTPYNSAFILEYLVKKGMIFQNWITWDKRDGIASSTTKYVNTQETILFFTKSKEHTFNYDEIRVPYISTERIKHAKVKGILKNGKRWFPNAKGKLCGEIWHISSERHKNKIKGKTPKSIHETPKPVQIIERIIRASSNENDLVLDCFVGSGTTAVVAKNLKRNFLCSDGSHKYVECAKKRLNGKISNLFLLK